MTWRGSVSYVTGAYNMKFGYLGGLIGALLALTPTA